MIEGGQVPSLIHVALLAFFTVRSLVDIVAPMTAITATNLVGFFQSLVINAVTAIAGLQAVLSREGEFTNSVMIEFSL